jgi:hypothetical protein
MGRPPAYTPEQDAVILSTKSTADILKRFEELGYETRNLNGKTIAARRQYLKKEGKAPVGTSKPEEDLIKVAARRREVQARVARLTAELDRLHRLQEELDRRLQESALAVMGENVPSAVPPNADAARKAAGRRG